MTQTLIFTKSLYIKSKKNLNYYISYFSFQDISYTILLLTISRYLLYNVYRKNFKGDFIVNSFFFIALIYNNLSIFVRALKKNCISFFFVSKVKIQLNPDNPLLHIDFLNKKTYTINGSSRY